jgi:lipopolysaccharide/colanic/teichoic acid biosynthesis glycosyltransferase
MSLSQLQGKDLDYRPHLGYRPHDTRGIPLVFTQWRVGLRGEGFEMIEFPSVSIEAELKHAGRGHVTRLGERR